MCFVGVGWTAVPADGHCDMQLRHEQPHQLCLCRHAAVGPRHSHASELRVCVLGRRSAHSEPLGSCCAPVAQDEAVRQQCQCCCNVETMLATAVARGCGPAALIRTRDDATTSSPHHLLYSSLPAAHSPPTHYTPYNPPLPKPSAPRTRPHRPHAPEDASSSTPCRNRQSECIPSRHHGTTPSVR